MVALPPGRALILLDTGAAAYTEALARYDETQPPIPLPVFIVQPSITGTPQVGQVLTGGGSEILYGAISARAWFLAGSSVVLTTTAAFTASVSGQYEYQETATGVGGVTTSNRIAVTVEATPTPTPAASYALSGPLSITEGNNGTKTAVYTVTRSGYTAQTGSVQYTTSDGTATAGVDYIAKSGTVSFLSGDTTKLISVEIIGDTDVEPNKTFDLTIIGALPTGSTITTPSVTTTITNDDTLAVTPENTRANSTQVRANRTGFSAPLTTLQSRFAALETNDG